MIQIFQEKLQSTPLDEIPLYVGLFVKQVMHNGNMRDVIEEYFTQIKTSSAPNLQLFLTTLNIFEFYDCSEITPSELMVKLQTLLNTSVSFTSFDQIQLFSRVCTRIIRRQLSDSIDNLREIDGQINQYQTNGLSQIAHGIWTAFNTPLSAFSILPTSFSQIPNPISTMVVINNLEAILPQQLIDGGLCGSIISAICTLADGPSLLYLEASLSLLYAVINLFVSKIVEITPPLPQEKKLEYDEQALNLIHVVFMKKLIILKGDPMKKEAFRNPKILRLLCKIAAILPTGPDSTSDEANSCHFSMPDQISLFMGEFLLPGILDNEASCDFLSFLVPRLSLSVNGGQFAPFLPVRLYYTDEVDSDSVIRLFERVGFDNEDMIENKVAEEIFKQDYWGPSNYPIIFKIIEKLTPISNDSLEILARAWIRLLSLGYADAMNYKGFYQYRPILLMFLKDISSFRSPHGLAAYANSLLFNEKYFSSITVVNFPHILATLCYFILQTEDLETVTTLIRFVAALSPITSSDKICLSTLDMSDFLISEKFTQLPETKDPKISPDGLMTYRYLGKFGYLVNIGKITNRFLGREARLGDDFKRTILSLAGQTRAGDLLGMYYAVGLLDAFRANIEEMRSTDVDQWREVFVSFYSLQLVDPDLRENGFKNLDSFVAEIEEITKKAARLFAKDKNKPYRFDLFSCVCRVIGSAADCQDDRLFQKAKRLIKIIPKEHVCEDCAEWMIYQILSNFDSSHFENENLAEIIGENQLFVRSYPYCFNSRFANPASADKLCTSFITFGKKILGEKDFQIFGEKIIESHNQQLLSLALQQSAILITNLPLFTALFGTLIAGVVRLQLESKSQPQMLLQAPAGISNSISNSMTNPLPYQMNPEQDILSTDALFGALLPSYALCLFVFINSNSAMSQKASRALQNVRQICTSNDNTASNSELDLNFTQNLEFNHEPIENTGNPDFLNISLIKEVSTEPTPRDQMHFIYESVSLFSESHRITILKEALSIITKIPEVNHSQANQCIETIISTLGPKIPNEVGSILFSTYQAYPHVTDRLAPLLTLARVSMPVFYHEFMRQPNFSQRNELFQRICFMHELRDDFFKQYIQDLVTFEVPPEIHGIVGVDLISKVWTFLIPLTIFNYLDPRFETIDELICLSAILISAIFERIKGTLLQNKIEFPKHLLSLFLERSSVWIQKVFHPINLAQSSSHQDQNQSESQVILSITTPPLSVNQFSSVSIEIILQVISDTIIAYSKMNPPDADSIISSALSAFTKIIFSENFASKWARMKYFQNPKIVGFFDESVIEHIHEPLRANILSDFARSIAILPKNNQMILLVARLMKFSIPKPIYLQLFNWIMEDFEQRKALYLALLPKVQAYLDHDTFVQDLMFLAICQVDGAEKMLFDYEGVDTIKKVCAKRAGFARQFLPKAVEFGNNDWVFAILAKEKPIPVPRIGERILEPSYSAESQPVPTTYEFRDTITTTEEQYENVYGPTAGQKDDTNDEDQSGYQDDDTDSSPYANLTSSSTSINEACEGDNEVYVDSFSLNSPPCYPSVE